jgi:hypothetical protein
MIATRATFVIAAILATIGISTAVPAVPAVPVEALQTVHESSHHHCSSSDLLNCGDNGSSTNNIQQGSHTNTNTNTVRAEKGNDYLHVNIHPIPNN